MACQSLDWCCIHVASSAFSRAVRITCPSMPAVLRPAFCSVTRRTLSSALARQRSLAGLQARYDHILATARRQPLAVTPTRLAALAPTITGGAPAGATGRPP